jgi:hypothetical protein
LIILKKRPGIARVAAVIKVRKGMFPQFKKLNNESGIVLFMVLMVAIIIMIFSVGILTQSMNEINYAQQQIDQIATDQMAKGIFWNAYSNGAIGSVTGVPVYINENGRNYAVTIAPVGAAVNGVTTYTVSANYDTFQ